jgi:GntR family transcriptional regulator
MATPKYIRIEQQIREMIDGGRISFGHRLPSERELSKEFGVDRKTVRKAIRDLENEGILVRKNGEGDSAYLNPQQPYRSDAIMSYSENIRAMGMKNSTKVLYEERMEAGHSIAKRLDIPFGHPVHRLVRLRLGDEKPMALQSTYIAEGLIEDFDRINFHVFSLYEVFAGHGIEIACVKETITPILIIEPEAGILGKACGQPCFMVEDVSYGIDGKPLEYTKSYINNKVISTESVLIDE